MRASEPLPRMSGWRFEIGEKMRAFMLIIALAATVGASAPSFAQTVNQREHRQERRINQGERSGALTPQEAYRLRMREHRLRMREYRMRRRNGGHLTAHDRRSLRQAESRNNQAIQRLKHNRRNAY